MKKIEKEVLLRKLEAEAGKVIISKTLNEFGNPKVVTKEIYLADGSDENEYLEINEEDLILNEEKEEV